MNINQIVKAKIVNIQKYGLFIDIDGKPGFCHISNVSNIFIKDINSIYSLNDIIDVKILSIDDKTNRYIVSIKDVEKHKERHSESFDYMLNKFLKISNEKNNDINKRNNKKYNCKKYKK